MKTNDDLTTALWGIPSGLDLAKLLKADITLQRAAAATDAIGLAMRLELMGVKTDVYTIENVVQLGIQFIEPKGLINAALSQILMYYIALENLPDYTEKFIPTAEKTVRQVESVTETKGLPYKHEDVKKYLDKNLKYGRAIAGKRC